MGLRLRIEDKTNSQYEIFAKLFLVEAKLAAPITLYYAFLIYNFLKIFFQPFSIPSLFNRLNNERQNMNIFMNDYLEKAEYEPPRFFTSQPF